MAEHEITDPILADLARIAIRRETLMRDAAAALAGLRAQIGAIEAQLEDARREQDAAVAAAARAGHRDLERRAFRAAGGRLLEVVADAAPP